MARTWCCAPVLAFGQDRAVLYPNPADGDAILYLGNSVQGTVRLRIMDQSGRFVREQDVVVADRRIPLRTAELSGGAYTVEVTGAGVAMRTVLIKQ
ncbi:MAG: T9SS type A sorting domain-containing protein [Flavobacteriales bacterium]|nr:T9SS type A sorting domain-containing protein [Flavobacteriales bacterium]